MNSLGNIKMANQVKEEKWGIPCCVNCVGLHPDEPITMVEAMNRIHNPQKVVAAKLMTFEQKRLSLYANKSCMLCGTTYDRNGNSDETFQLTAERVAIEFRNMGIHGVNDADIKKVVATCRKSWVLLWKNRATIKPADAEKMTFAGRLALIITHAMEAREKRNTIGGGQSLNKGLIL